MSLTVSDVTPLQQYAGNGVQLVFSVPFEFRANSDIKVYVDGTLKTLTTDYTVSGAATTGGGSITFVSAPANGSVVTVYRDMPIARTSNSYADYSLLPASVLEQDLDDLTMKAQQLERDIGRALHVSPLDTATSANMELPNKAQRLGKLLYFDATNGLPEMLDLASVGGLSSPISKSLLGSTLDPSTAAEISAGVTPSDYTGWSGPLIDGKRFGFVGDNSTLNDTAMANAIAVCTQYNGGVLVLGPGSYVFSAGFELPESMQIWGSGMFSTLLKANGNFTLVTLGSTDSSRNALRNLGLQGTGKLGTGIRIGDTAHSGYHTFENVYIASFFTGVRLSAALWSSFYNCLITGNENGVDYNAGSGSMYSNAIEFHGCTIISNDRSGIAATSTPVRNIGLKYIGGSIEQNGTEAPATYPQVVLGATAHFYFNTYIESTAGTKPDGFSLSNASNGEIANTYFNGTATGIKSSSAGCNAVFIHNCRFVSTTTKCIDLPSCPQVLALHNEYDTTNTIDSASSSDVTGAVPGQSSSSYTGTLTGCTTSPTGSVEYLVTGKLVTLKIPQILGTSNTTACTITGMPAAIRPASSQFGIITVRNNGNDLFGDATIDTGGVITLANGVLGTAFTGSGQKGTRTGTITYPLT